MTPVIELRDVTRSFPGAPEVQALRAVSLLVRGGDYLAITGPSGSGKSTMLNILGLLDRPSVGSYYLNGVLVSDLNENERANERAKRIGFVFQSFHLLPRRSVLDNVMLPLLYGASPRQFRKVRALEALERVGLSHRSAFSPAVLSGGERQRVAIARAIVTGPSILLADEPTGNLDRGTSDEIMCLFEELNSDGLTLIVITHDPQVAGRAGQALRLADGKVVGSVP